jgi:urease accessory protein
MGMAEAGLATGWNAALALTYVRRGAKTVLAQRSHSGPLRVQRDLYPEGAHTCHTILVHPPGGVAGGDSLDVRVKLEAQSGALLTTPGAGKWYGSTGAWAAQALRFDLGPGAVLEWLPQETIVYDRARADMSTSIHLQEGAAYMGWEILCLGRTASGERFMQGALRQRAQVMLSGNSLWVERTRLEGNDPLLASPVGLAGRTVSATMLAAGRDIPDGAFAECRKITPGEDALGGVTRLPKVAIARYLGDSGEQARSYFASLWGGLRPVLKGCAAAAPRVWAT